jgi:hypothetical protein
MAATHETDRGVADGLGRTPERAADVPTGRAIIVRPASLMNVKRPSWSVTQTRSGDEATR